MSRMRRFAAVAPVALVLLLALQGLADAQRRPAPRHPPHPDRGVVVRGHVFIGGYFYDPFFGPYPWWPRTAYPYWYRPIYDNRAELKVQVEPDEADRAAVYVDGFYAGVVDDFDGVFQSLPLTPGGHTVVLYLEGYRTARHHIYLSPASTFRLRETMERLPVGESSEPPELAPPVPEPPAGSYRRPATPPPVPAPPSVPRAVVAEGFGTVDLYVQPANAEVTIDGERWTSSDDGHYVVQVPIGTHRVEISRSGYRRFSTEVEVAEGQTLPLNVSLISSSS